MKKFVNSIIFVLLTLLFFSCEIGLGAAVDTQPPTIDISSPVPDAVIRGAFNFGGTWSDDGTISSLYITLEKTDGTATYGPFEGNLTESEDEQIPNTWSCIVDPSNGQILDGSYVATVSITDEGEHTTTQSRQFAIDNTAPLIVLQRPSSKASDSAADSYGQTFTLEGQAADDNNVDLIEVQIFADPECTSLLNTVQLSNVPNTINLDVAKFAEGVDNDYSKMYGSTSKNGTKQLYCKIMAYDGAQHYPVDGSNQSPEDLRGNVTTSYYMYEDIATSILSNHKITEVYHMLNGSYLTADSSRSAETVTGVTSLLSSNVVTTGRFSLNPANNPTFSVSGHENLKGDGSDFTNQEHCVSNGGTIVVEVATGLDAIPLNGDSLKPLLTLCDSYGNAIGGASPITPKYDVSKSGTSYKFVCTLSTAENSGLSVGSDYILTFAGSDQSGNNVIPAGSGSGYGFHLASSGAAPLVNVTSPVSSISYIKSGVNLPITGTISVEEGIPLLVISNGDNVVYRSNFTVADSVKLEDARVYSFSYLPVYGDSSSQNSFSIKASLDGQSTVVSKTIMYDTDQPTIQLLNLGPTANKYNDAGAKVSYTDDSGATNYYYLNGTVTFKASITDAFDTVASAKWELIQSGHDTPVKEGYFDNPTNAEVSFDTTTLDDNKNVTLRITAVDRAGNPNTKDFCYKVDQSTDLPIILANDQSTVDFEITDYDKLKAANNLKNVFVNGQQLMLKLIDDDSLKTITVSKGEFTKVTNNGTVTYTEPASLTLDIDNSPVGGTEYVYPYPLPSTTGIYKLEIELTDTNGVSSGKKNIVIKTTPAAPEVTVESDKNWIQKNKADDKFKVTVTIDSEQSPFKIERSINSGAWEVIKTDLSTLTYEDTEIKPTSTLTYYYKVTDVNNHSSTSKSVKLGVDSKVDDLQKSAWPTKENTKNASFTFRGTAKDEESGVKNVTIKIEGTKSGNPVSKELPATGTTDWFLDLTYTDSDWEDVFKDEGTKTVTITAEDNVGNTTDISDTFIYDKANPSLDVDPSSIKEFIPSSGYDITGTASDSYSFDSLTVKEYFKSPAAVDYAETTESKAGVTATFTSATNWKQHIPFGTLNNGFYKYEFIAKDTVGNITTFSKDNIQVDTTVPEVTVTSPKDIVANSNGYTKNNFYTFEGTVYDLNLDKVTVYLQKKNAGTWADVANQKSEVTPNSATAPINPKGWEWKVYDLTDGEYRVRVEATDKAGNSVGLASKGQAAVTSTGALTVDLTAPVSVITSSGLVEDNGTTVAGTTDISAQSETKFYAKESGTPASVAPFTISGVITETNYDKDKVTLTAKKDDANITAPSITVNADKTWSFAPILKADGTNDGTYKYTITIKDKADNRTDYVVNVCYDSQKPTVSITSPVADEIINNSTITASGAIRDTGIGLKSLEYSVDGGSTWTAGNTITVSSNASSWSKTWNNLSEGAINLKMRATDFLGHVEESTAVRFSYDQNPPVLDFTALSDYYNTGNITLTGKAYDTNLLKSVTISDEYTAGQSTTTNSYPVDITSGAIATAKSDGTKLTWSKTLSTGTLGDGTHKFTVTAEDDAGRKTHLSWNTTVDTTKPTVKLDALPGNNDTLASSYTFTGTAADATSGVDEVYITISGKKKVNGTDTAYSHTEKVNGTQVWNYTVTYSDTVWEDVFADEGVKTVTLEVKDKAGLSETSFTYAQEATTSASKTFDYDNQKPELNVDSSSVKDFIPQGGYTITGTASDSYKFGSLTIKEYFKTTAAGSYAETTESKAGVTVTVNQTDHTWAKKIPLKTLEDGYYKYSFILKDYVGNTVTYTKDGIQVDQLAPVATVTEPSEYTKNDNYTFKGTAYDLNLDKVTVYLQKKNAGTWADVANQKSEVTPNSATAPINPKGWEWKVYDLTDGEYRVRVEATDKAGNSVGLASKGQAAVTSTGVLTVDLTAPVSVITSSGLVEDNGTTVAGTTDISAQSETKFYAKESGTPASVAPFTISGVITETNFDVSKVTLSAKKDDVAVAAGNLPALTVAADGTWSFAPILKADGTNDGTYKYTITIKDKADNRTDYVVNVCYDSQKPTVSITSPVADEIINNSTITANGAIRDTGIGLKSLEYSVDGGSTWAAGNTINVSSNASSWTNTWTGLQEGAINLKMRATDFLGHVEESTAVRFSYDQNPPALDFTALSDYYNTGNITLTGKAYDTNLLKSVTISDEYTAGQSTTTNSYPVDITSGAIATAKSDGTKLTWSKTLSTGTLGDGTHKFTVTAEDDAGRKTHRSCTTIVDTTKPTATLESLPSRTDTQANGFTFRGTAADVTSGVDKVELTITGANGKKRTVKVTGKENWYYSLTYADDTAAASETGASGNTWKEVFGSEGITTVTIKVYDKAGLSETSFTYADEASTSASKTFTYDKENPQFAITGTSILEYMPETGFTVTGSASDSYKLSGATEGVGSIVVTEYHKGTASGATFAETSASKSASYNTFNVSSVTNHSGSISIPLPLNLAGLPNGKPVDGTYKYTFTLKDSVGNTTTYNINQVIVDTTAPVITVATPASDTAKTGTNAINETNFRFDGTITEANVVAGVYYKIIPSTGSAPSVPAGSKILAETWTNAGWTAATSGTASWSANQAFISGTTSNASAFCEGLGYKMYVYAVDKAGNYNTTAVTRTFDVDLSYPTVTTRVGNAAGASKVQLDTSTTQVKTLAYSFDFNVADTFGLDTTPYTVVLRKDDVTLGTTTSTTAPYYAVGTAVSGYYPITITVPAGVKGDGLYEYTVTAKDKAGKTTSVTRNIRLDTKAPELSILSPDLTGYQNGEKVTVKGSAEDDSGTLAVWYAYGVASEPAVPSTGTTLDNSWTTNSWNKATGTTSWTIKDLTGVEGTGKNLFIRAVDKNGLVSTVQSGTINIDLSNPTSTTDETALIKNADFSFTGTVYDPNGINSVTIVQSGQADATYSTDSSLESTPSITVTGGTAKLALAKADDTKAEWTKNFTVSSLTDGIYNFSIKVKDAAGKETIKSRSVTVDKTDPTIGTPTLTWTDTPATGASHTVNTGKLSVSPTDANLDSVYYFVNNGSDTTITGTDKVSATLWETIIPTERTAGGVTTTVYEKDISFADGDGTVYIKVTDKAGNVTYNTSLTYSVDTTKPEKPTLGKVDGEDLSETKMINGTATVTFKVTARDQNDNYNNSGTKVGLDATKVASVNLSKIGTTAITVTKADDGQGTATFELDGTTKTGEWTVTIPTSAFTGLSAGVKPVYVKVADISGNVEEYEMFSIELDNVKPVPSITTPNASTINGTLDVTGSVTENYPKSVGLYYRTSVPSSSDHSDTTTAGWTLIKEYVKGSGTDTTTRVYTNTTSDINKFTFANLDFNTISGASGETLKKHDIWLLVYAEDTAGNASVINSTQYTVDMDEDRPVIKFSNITLASMTASTRVGFENSELYGSVTDDDGVPETVQYYIGASAPAANSSDWIPPAANSNFIYSNGSFTLKFLTNDGKPNDGEKNIFFKVVDKANNTFISSASTTYDSTSVKVTDGTNAYGTRPANGTTTTASTVYLKVDTQAPDVYAEGYYLGATATTDDTGWSTAITAATFGGTQNQFYLRQYAYDANGVSTVVVHIPVDAEDVATGEGAVSGYANTTDETKPSVKGYYEYAFTEQSGANSTITSNGTTYTKWVSSVINVTGMKSGTRQCEIIVSDGIKQKTTPVNISIDNAAPTVIVESQTANEQMRAAFLMKGQFQDGDQGTQLWYNLSTTTTPGAWSSDPVEATTAMNWRIAFDGDENPQDTYTHDGVPKQIIAALLSDVEIASSGDNSGKAVWKTAGTVGGVTHAVDDLYTPITTVYFHFKVQDALGNESTTYIPLKLDPQGDIPVITLVSPDSTQTTLGGTIRFSGSAEDDATIAGLYVEVDPQYNAANGFVAWSSTHKTPAYTKDGVTVAAKAPADVITSANYPNNPYELINEKVASGKKKTTTVKAIYIGNGLSWNIALNKYGEFDNKEAGINKVAVRFYAVDVDGNMSQPTDPFVFDIDCDKPKIGNSQRFYLKQYSDNTAGTGNVTASVEYTDGMWLKGEWWLEGSVEDESGIASVTMKGESIAASSTAVSKGNGANQWPNTSGYITHYKVGNATANLAGNLEYTLAITDNDGKTNEKVFSINYDNKAPTLAETTDENYSISSTVKNSNGFYTIRSAVTEGSDESGFDKVVFYFKRTTTGYQNVYDSYMAKTYTDNGVKKTDKNQFAYGSLTYEDYLYWRTATLSSVSGNTITISAKDENIHVGGLVKVDGVIYTIKGINTAGTILTLNGNPSESATGTIYYAIGHVVDHAGAESTGTNAGKITTADTTNYGYGYGYYGNSPDDDGDKMIETVSTSGTRTIWSASINSNNIPDGPIELHYVAFDKAGNIAHGVVDNASVANNAPRLAGVTIWTDYNGNGKGWRNSGEHAADYESETKSKYYARVRPFVNGVQTDRSNDVTSKLIVSSNDYGIEDATSGTAYMKVTDTVKIIPEIVGGNNELYYEYKIGKKSAFTVTNGSITGFTASIETGSKAMAGGTAASQLPLKNDSDANVSGNDEGDEYPKVTDSNTTLTYVNGHTDGVITFDTTNFLANLDNTTTEEPTWFDITIWDSTEGGTPYSNTLSCEMQIALMNKYNDEVKPWAWIRPFHWNSKDDNSLSWATDDEGNQTPEGHIELEGDLTSAIHTAMSTTKANPKVSGKIVVEGYAYDDIKLAKLYVSFADHSNIGSKTEASTYSSTGWSTTDYANGWGFSAQDVFCNAEGHLVKWTLTVDTAARTTKVGTGKQVQIYAEAARGGNTYKNSIDTSSTQTVNLAQFVWSAVKSDTTNTYYTSPDRLTVATRANTADTAIVYANAYEYQWLNVKNSGGTYYTDLACTTAATSSTADTAKVYQKAQYTWSTVKSTVTPATQTTYFTDASCTTLANATTPDATVVYKNTMTSGYTVDIVPYVVKVETNLSKHKTSNPSVYNRTALGHYPVQSVAGKVSTTASGSKTRTTSSEDITIYGFNLNGSSVVLKNESNDEIKKADNSALAITKTAPTTSAMSSLKFNVATLPSGKLNVIVDSINIINNLNNNNAMGKATAAGTSNSNKYNMQGNGDTNNILTDDLVFDVWEFNDRAAVPINGMATGVQMQVNQTGKLLNFAFANGGLYYSMGDSTYSSRYWAGDWDTFAGPCVGLGVDSKGYTYSVASGGDTNNSGHVDKYAFYTSRWGCGTRGTGGTYGGDNALRLEEIALKTGDGTYAYSLMKYRYLSSEFASTVSGDNTNLYLVNYDALTDEIRFRAGTFGDTSKSTTAGAYLGFVDTYSGQTPSYYATANCQVIANNSTSGGSFPIDTNGGNTTVNKISGRGAGQYVDVAVATNGTGNKDAVCVVWFDAYSNSLKYTYYVDPISNWNSLKGNRTAAGWSTPKTIFAEGGEYCQIAVDANNHIHIAAYAGNGDVKYAYLDSYNSDYVEKTNSCTVDASGAVGEHLTLDVALDANGNSIPYIGYFTSAIKAPKYAYLVDTTHANKVPAGVDSNERFTGAWEVTVIPTPSRLTTNREDKVNIGVFKNAGVLNWSTTDGSAPANDKSNIGTSYSQSSTGDYDACTEESKCYGNGSKNAVFAYQIAGGTGSCVESAQMR